MIWNIFVITDADDFDDIDANAGPCSKEFLQQKKDEELALALEKGGAI